MSAFPLNYFLACILVTESIRHALRLISHLLQMFRGAVQMWGSRSPWKDAECLMFLEKATLLYLLLFAMSVCSSVCVPTSTYFASICKAWKSETQEGPLRKYTTVCRNKHTH